MKKSSIIKFLVLVTLTTSTAVQAQISHESFDHNAGQFQTSKVDDIVKAGKELDLIFAKISDLNDEVGMTMDDSHGFLKALGERLDIAQSLKDSFAEIKANDSNANQMANELLLKGRENLSISKALVIEAKKYQ